MKLYVTTNSGQKVYLRTVAATKGDLANQIGSAWFDSDGTVYHVNSVLAEAANNTATGAVVGGLVGILLGPIGVIGGGLLGGLLGNESDKEEEQRVQIFNSSAL